MKQTYCFFSTFAHRVLTVASARAKLLTAIALCLFSVGNILGGEAVLTLSTSNKFGTNNGATLKDSQGITWTSTFVSSNVQNQYIAAYSGQQFGSAQTTGTNTFTADFSGKTVSKIVVTAAAGNTTNTISVNVNGTSWGNYTLTKNSTPYSFTGSATGEIEIVLTQKEQKANYLGSITVTYESGPIEYTITNSLTNVTADANNPEKFTGTEEDVTLYYTAKSGYTLPDEVSVSMGGNLLSASKGEYYWYSDGTEGYATLYPSSVAYKGLGDIVITIKGGEIKEPTATITPTEWDFGDVIVGTSVSKTFTLTTENLTSALDVVMYMEEDGFGVTPTTISSTATSTSITVTYKPTASQAGTEVEELLSISGGGLTNSVDVSIKANAVEDPCQGITLSAPTVTVSDLNPTGFTLSWSAVAGAEGYNVYLFKGTNPKQEVGELITATTYTFTTLTPNETYGWEVEAVKEKCYKTTGRQSVTTPKRSYTVTWMLDGAAYTDGNPTTKVFEGEGITALPTPPANDALSECATEFMGWSTANLGSEEGKTDPGNLFKTADQAPAITGNTTFYAVYATASTTGGGSTNHEVVFSENGYGNQDVVTTVSVATEITIQFAKGSNSNAPKYFNTGKAVRCYGGNTFTIISGTEKITSVVLTFSSGGDSNAIGVNVGELTTDYTTWKGETSSVTFTIAGTSGHRRISTILITCGSSSTTYINYVTACEEEVCNLSVPLKPESGNITSTSATLTWNAVTGATGYVVTLTAGGVSKEITTTDNKCELADLQPATKYTWTVKATKGKCESVPCSTKEFTTLVPCTPLAMPTNVKVEWVEGNQYKLSWDKVTNATCYKITGQFSTASIKQNYTIRTLDLTRGREYTGTIIAMAPDDYKYCDSNPADYSFVYKPYTVTFNAGSGTCPVASSEETTIEELPEAQNNCEGWEFVGWSTVSCAETTTLSALVTAPYTPTSDHTLYAVYSKTESDESGGEQKMITLTATDFNLPSSSYGERTATKDSYSFMVDQGHKGNNGEIQLNTGKGEGVLYNTTAIPNLKAISLNVGTGSNVSTVYEGTSRQPLDNVAGTSGTSATIPIAQGNEFFTIQVSGVTYFNSIEITYGGATEVTTYSSNPSCTPCNDAEWYFELGSRVQKIPGAANFTNTLISTNTNPVTYKSSNPSVATVNPTTGEVTVVALGETTITAKQSRSGDICPVVADYLLVVQEPQVEVVEVTPNSIILEHDFDGETEVVMQERVTTVEGVVANDIFFSKYFEAASYMKLIAIYNGTDHPIDFSKLRIRVANNEAWPTAVGERTYIDLGNISKLVERYPSKMLPQLTEIILWSNNKGTAGENDATYNEQLRECIEVTIDKKTYTYNDMEKGNIPNWYCIGGNIVNNTFDDDHHYQMQFNGDDAIILERLGDDDTWAPIDLIGAGSSEAPDQSGTQNKVNNITDGKGWLYYEDDAIALSTNRCLLYRKKGVKDGLNAVKQNVTDFITLGTEWEGKLTGVGNNSYCTSGEMFAELAEFDYAHYFTEFVTLTEEQAGITHNPDGTITVKMDDLTDRACDFLNINVLKKGTTDTIAHTYYKVPIIVQGAKLTNDEIFTKEGTACTTCDVVILNNSSLTKAPEGTAGDITAVRDLEVYAGGKLDLPVNCSYQVRSLALRSKEDVVSSATLEGDLKILLDNTYHDKRIQASRWYWITLPQDCPVSNVTFRNGEPAEYGVDWLLKTYDGEQRANTQKGGCWKPFEGTTIKAGVGYILAITPKSGHTYRELRFPMPGYGKAAEHSAKDVPVDDYGAGMDITPNHKGWNLVGNPYLSYYQSSSWDGLTVGRLVENDEYEYELAGTIPYVTIPQNAGYSEYTQEAIGEYGLPPFTSYFVQVGGATPHTDPLAVNFAADGRKARSVAERRMPAQTADKAVRVTVTLANAAGEQDKTTLVMSNRYTDAYEIGADLLKWRGSQYTRYSKPVLASAGQDGELAFHALADAAAQQGVRLHYFAAQQGEYTFSLVRGYDFSAVKEVILYDTETGTSVNLLQQNYRFRSDRQDNKTRFVLSVRVERTPAVTTGIDRLQTGIYAVGEAGALHLFNLPAGSHVRIYDSLGRLVADDDTDALQAVYPVGCAGVYNVSVTVAGENQTLRTIVK